MSATFEPIRRRPCGTCGFTLVEMLVILAILSLMAGILFPSVERALQRQSFVDSARRVELGLRAARAMAVERGEPVHFAVSKDGHRFGYADRQDRLPDSTLVRSPGRGITFFGDGSATGGEIEVADGRLGQRIVVRNALGLIERAR